MDFCTRRIGCDGMVAGDALAQRPGGGGGGRGRGGRGSRGGSGGFLPGRVQETLKLTDAQKKKVEALQKEISEKLNKILTAAQKKTLEDMRSGRGRTGGNRGTISVDSIMARRDKNKDGKISKEEAGTSWDRFYKAADKNNDGSVDKKELEERLKSFRRGGGTGGRRRPGGGGRGINVDQILARRDANKDGKISKKEAGDRWDRTYAPLDKNKDGYVDKKELAELANRSRGGRRRPGGGNRQID